MIEDLDFEAAFELLQQLNTSGGFEPLTVTELSQLPNLNHHDAVTLHKKVPVAMLAQLNRLVTHLNRLGRNRDARLRNILHDLPNL